jgi:hypothetical protein
LVFEGNNKVLTELERFYKLEEPYIRYLTILFEGDPHERIFGDAVQSTDDIPAVIPVPDDDEIDSEEDTADDNAPVDPGPNDDEIKSDELETTDTMPSEPNGTEETEKE